jgi:hypothetical protein
MTTNKINRRDFLKLALAGIGTFVAVQIGAKVFGLKHAPGTLTDTSTPDLTATPTGSLIPTSTPTESPVPTSTLEETATTASRMSGKEIEQRISASKIPIIEYHYLGYSAEGVSEPEELFLSQTDFFQQNGFKTITDVDLGNYLEGKATLPAKSFVIRIDQGAAHFQEFEKMLNILEDKGFSALVFVISGDQYSDEQWGKFANWYKNGLISLGSHSITHPDFTLLNYNQAYDEAVYSKRAIQNRLAQLGIDMEVTGFAFPYDSVPDKIDFLKAAGYQFGMGGNLFGVRDNSALKGQYLVPSLYPYVMQSLLEEISANNTNNLRAVSLTSG